MTGGRRTLGGWRWASICLCLALGVAHGQEPDPRLAERDRLLELAKEQGPEREPRKRADTYTKILAIERAVYGDAHEDIAATLDRLAFCYKRAGDFEAAVRVLDEQIAVVAKLHGADDWRVAQARGERQDLEIQARFTPAQRNQDRRATRLTREILAMYKAGNRFDPRVLTMWKEVVQLRIAVGGENYVETAQALDGLATQYIDTVQHKLAEETHLRALRIRIAVRGPQSPGASRSYFMLGKLYIEMGELRKAMPMLRQSEQIRRKAEGSRLASTMSMLAKLHSLMGDREEAMRCATESVAIGRAHQGHENRLSEGLARMGELHYEAGAYAEAQRCFRECLEIKEQRLDPGDTRVALTMGRLSLVYAQMGAFDKAEPLGVKALGIWRASLDKDNPKIAIGLSHLAAVYLLMGAHEKSERLFREALAIRQKFLGEQHPDTGASMQRLAAVCWELGKYEEAAWLARGALAVRLRLLHATAAGQSERTQMQMAVHFRRSLDAYLVMAPRGGERAADIYALAVAWKGTVFARQARLRTVARQPELRGLFDQYAVVAGELATVSLLDPEPAQLDAWRSRTNTLNARKEALERELSQKSAEFRELQESTLLTPAMLRDSLPNDAALVDFVEYADSNERRFVAFVVRKARDVECVYLGPSSTIETAVAKWRATRGRHGGAELRRLLWEPLADAVTGADTVLVSPDGAIGRVSFAGLPGAQPGTYLIEDVAVAVVPVPQLLPRMLAERTGAQDAAASLMLLGDVDYGARPRGVPAGSHAFAKLVGTRGEIVGIRDSFEQRHADGKVTVLRGAGATEAAFRDQAGKHRWIHAATHGFFAPPDVGSAMTPQPTSGTPDGMDRSVVGTHPGLLSGLALAGANLKAADGDDDGILTAMEVATLDLSGVEVAVLSACETGLGQIAAGEGILGLQRAFQVSGARTTVTSLLKVPDTITSNLMLRFYENLWQNRMGKLAALREAQLWMLKESRTPRSLDIGADEEAKRAPPDHWASFVLAGDWR